MVVVRKTSAPVVLSSFMCVKASQKALSSLCPACSKLFVPFQPVIYENTFEEIVELKYCILLSAHHYVEICFTNKTGWSGERSRLKTVWICKFTLCLSSDHPPPAFSLGRVLLPQLYPGPLPRGLRQKLSLSHPSRCQSFNTHTKKGLLPMPFLPNCHIIFLSLGQRRQDTACGRGCMVQALGRGMATLQASCAPELWLQLEMTHGATGWLWQPFLQRDLSISVTLTTELTHLKLSQFPYTVWQILSTLCFSTHSENLLRFLQP